MAFDAICDAPTTPSPSAGEAKNLALGRQYMLSPAPNYGYNGSRNLKEDLKSLTDGYEYSGPSQPWIQKGCPGWVNRPYVKICVDLERTEPISGVAFHTAFDGPTNVKWLNHITVFTSDDGKAFREVCDLVSPEWPDGLPADIPAISGRQLRFYEYRNMNLATKGRYVCFVVDSPSFIFCDEVKVFQGQASSLDKEPSGKDVGDIDLHMNRNIFNTNVKKALREDLDFIRRSADGFCIREQVEAEIQTLDKKIKSADFPMPPDGFRATAPLNELHRQIFRLNAEVLTMKRMPKLMAWNANRWAPLHATETPGAQGRPSMSFEMMRNEFRSEALNLTNSSNNDIKLKISLSGLPGGNAPDYISVFQVEFVWTAMGGMIADPLSPMKSSPDGYEMDIPSGMTRQVWITSNPKALEAGVHDGSLVLRYGDGLELKVPFRLKLRQSALPANPHLSLGMWDYAMPASCDQAAGDNDMKLHYVDTAYGHHQMAAIPPAGNFDKDGKLTAPLNTTAFDKWIEKHRDRNRFLIYLQGAGIERSFAEEPFGTPRFDQMVSQWAAAFHAYVKGQGIDPSRIMLHFIDEPHLARQFRVNAAYAKLIKAAAPGFKLFTDTAFIKGDADMTEMIKASDIVCIHLPEYGYRMDLVEECLNEAVVGKKEISMYSSLGPARLFDPYYYHRLQAWHAWRRNASSMSFWCYWNYYPNASASAWNELTTKNVQAFGVVYSDATSLASSKHWEAVREGMEDYEYLFMLKAKTDELKAKSEKADAVKNAEKLLATLPSKVAGTYERHAIYWTTPKDRDSADQARIEILNALENLR